MDEIIAATGSPQYNVLRRLEARGYEIRKVKEGRATRYFAAPPETGNSLEATVSANGQVTIPKEIREKLKLLAGRKVKFVVEAGDRVVMSPLRLSVTRLFGILGKPSRSVSPEEMDEAVRKHAVERFRRAVERKR